MRKLRGFIPTTALLVTLAFGATAANAGIIIANRAETPEPCKEDSGTDLKGIVNVLAGIIIANKTGIIIANKDGLLISDFTSSCDAGASKNGLLISD